MLFNSFEYLLFLPAITLAYFLLPNRYRWILLLAGSYFFYMYWRPEFGLLLLASTAIDYVAAIRMSKSSGKKRKRWLWLSIGSNLGLLIAFKYLGFLNEAFRELFQVFDFNLSEPKYSLLLPIGISFYTFQTLSYTIDVYRKRREPEKHFGIFALYVSFFPQLIAGPIERSTHLLPQFRIPHRFSLQRLADGGRLIAWGLFKKVLIADTIANYTNAVFFDLHNHSGGVLLASVYAFGFQQYMDFSGYTDIAIGSALIMGYDLMSNFERPWKARNAREFWSRWHISLTSWLFDYLYKPLARTFRQNWLANIFILFLVMGLWHGAGTGFILFGLFNALFYIFSYFTIENYFGLPYHRITPRVERWIQRAGNFLTLAFIGFSVGFQRLITGDQILLFFRKLFTEFNFNFSSLFFMTQDLFLLATTIPLIFYVESRRGFLAKRPFHSIRQARIRWIIYFFLIFYLLMFGDKTAQEFYYYQF